MKNKIIVSLFTLVAMFFMTKSGYSQLFSTKLKITVINSLGSFTEGATVSLYTSMDDYRSNKNAVMSGVTDEKGRIKFKDLAATVYFIDARKADMNNDGAGVETGTLDKGKVNKVNIVIE